MTPLQLEGSVAQQLQDKAQQLPDKQLYLAQAQLEDHQVVQEAEEDTNGESKDSRINTR